MDGIEMLIPIIAIVSTFGTVIVLIYLFFTSRHRERMALIEHGLDARIFRKDGNGQSALKFGILLFAAGLGIFAGFVLDSVGMESDSAYFSMIFLFTGAGLIGYHLMQRKIRTPDDEV